MILPNRKTPIRSQKIFINLNLHRRHLTAPQLACVATDSLPYFEQEAEKRMKAGKAPDPTVKLPEGLRESREKAAEAVGVSPRYVSDAKKIKEESPETFERLKVGDPTPH